MIQIVFVIPTELEPAMRESFIATNFAFPFIEHERVFLIETFVTDACRLCAVGANPNRNHLIWYPKCTITNYTIALRGSEVTT